MQFVNLRTSAQYTIMKVAPTKLVSISVLLCFILGGLYLSSNYLNFDYIQSNLNNMQTEVRTSPIFYSIIYVIVYILVVMCALPGAALITMLGGALFGWQAIPLTLIGATIGAIGAFFLSRYFIGSYVQKKFSSQLQIINQEINTFGSLYFLSIRISPVFPFWLVNLLAGLTTLKLWQYTWLTAVGIIPGTIAYTYAGYSLSTITKPSEALSPKTISALLGIALVSWLTTFCLRLIKRKHTTTKQQWTKT
jgi:uncharacterized membrane protein YdjX (TVP38/TMEM64 family)